MFRIHPGDQNRRGPKQRVALLWAACAPLPADRHHKVDYMVCPKGPRTQMIGLQRPNTIDIIVFWP